jgi:hypothetical protein
MEEQSSSDERVVGRRRLLRRAGVVAAGIAGAGAVGAVTASPAGAAAGSPVLAGQSNDAGTQSTSLSSASLDGTLTLKNTVTTTSSGGGVTTTQPPQLVLVPAPGSDSISTDAVGSVAVTDDGRLWIVAEQGTHDLVYTGFNATMTVPILTQRVFDTRDPNNRQRIINRSTALEASTGRVLAGKIIDIDLSGYVQFGQMVFANITVVQPPSSGYVSLFPGGTPYVPAKTPSTLNYGANAILANGAVTGIGQVAESTSTDVVSMYVQTLAHVLLDITAFVVNYQEQINPNILVSAGLSANAKTAARAQAPSRAELARRYMMTRKSGR